MEWVDGNLGYKLTMKYPNCVILGEGEKGSTLSIAFLVKDEHIFEQIIVRHKLDYYTKAALLKLLLMIR